jgi:4-amino-4-deoxy-L-arabinose transferase-like glycosyltransferase
MGGLPPASPANRATWRDHVVVGALTFVVALALAMSWGWDPADDSWLLQVASRTASGEVMYRDFYVHVTPLALYLLAIPTLVFGAQIMSLKILVALVFAGVVLVACRINEQLGSARRYSPLLILALFVFASPGRMVLVSLYTHLANSFLLAAFTAWLSWRASGDNRRLYATGVLLALCFASKQNTGAYGAVAFAIATAAYAFSQNRDLQFLLLSYVRAAGAFILTGAIILLPVIATGSLSLMLRSGLSDKGTYFAVGGMSYLKPIASLAEAFRNPLSLAALRYMNAAAPFIFPFVLLPLLTWALAREDRNGRATAIAIAAFAAAALAVLYPRADPQHMLFATPILLIALAWCWRELRARPTKPAIMSALDQTRSVALAGTLCAAAFMSASTLARVLSPEYEWSTLPHHSGPLMPRIIHDGFKRNLPELVDFPRDGRTFFLGPYAAFYYLAGELHNPTRYDYPYSVSLGSVGTPEIIAAIRSGKIARVCIDSGGIPELKAYDLQHYVRATMVRQPIPDFCEQYTTRATRGAHR